MKKVSPIMLCSMDDLILELCLFKNHLIDQLDLSSSAFPRKVFLMPVWPDLYKFRHFRQICESLWHFLNDLFTI